VTQTSEDDDLFQVPNKLKEDGVVSEYNGDKPLRMHIRNFELARKGIKTNAIMTRTLRDEEN